MVLVIVMADASEDIKPNVRAVEVRMVMRVCAVMREDIDEVGCRCVRLVSAYAGQWFCAVMRLHDAPTMRL